ncbi:unnamed protein product, partial [Meganyctiphanes norvegica]
IIFSCTKLIRIKLISRLRMNGILQWTSLVVMMVMYQSVMVCYMTKNVDGLGRLAGHPGWQGSRNFLSMTGRPSKEKCSYMCPRSYIPVCGSDGKTYPNERCFHNGAGCENPNLKIVSKGPCNEKDKVECSYKCTRMYRPVCGSDGKTYGNEQCFRNGAQCENPNLKIVSGGPCEEKRN